MSWMPCSPCCANTDCCASNRPANLTITITVTAGACAAMDGVTGTVPQTSAGVASWSSTSVLNNDGNALQITLNCSFGTTYFFECKHFGFYLNPHDLSCSSANWGIVSCSPYHFRATGCTDSTGNCPGATFTVDMTE